VKNGNSPFKSPLVLTTRGYWVDLIQGIQKRKFLGTRVVKTTERRTMNLVRAINILESKGVKITRLTDIWFCNEYQVTESEMIKWATILAKMEEL
jgi:hypothetical protein